MIIHPMSGRTRIYLKLGLIGYPVSHSLSPLIHQAALKQLDIAGEYNLHAIPPLPEGRPAIEGILKQLRSGQICGLSVTIPHKQSVLPYLDELTGSSLAIGAVNTIYMKSGRLIGDNTDASGFWADLQPRLESSGNFGQALVLGAGGSARAVVYTLLQKGWHITVAARRTEQGKNIAEDFEQITPSLQTIPFNPDGLKNYLVQTIARQSSRLLIVNTTPVGMFPDNESNPWFADIPFPKDAYIYDLIYNPAETLLVRTALTQGVGASNGLGMLVEQAALAFERWTDLSAPRQVMHAAVQNHLHPVSLQE